MIALAVRKFEHISVQTMQRVFQKLASGILIMDDAPDPYDHAEDAMGEDVHGGNIETQSNERRAQITPSDMVETMRSFNERLTKGKEEKNQINPSILQSLTNLQYKSNLGLNHNNGGKDRKNLSNHSTCRRRVRISTLYTLRSRLSRSVTTYDILGN